MVKIDNSLMILADSLIEHLKNQNNFFDSSFVVVPDRKMAKWFKAYWLKTNNDVLMNVEFDTFEKSFLNLIETDSDYSLTNKEEIKLLIIKYLNKFQDSLPKEIKEYFLIDSTINGLKIYDLASELASLFIDYEKDLFKINGYQKTIYDSLIEDLKKNRKGTFLSIYKNKKGFCKNKKVYLFGFTQYSKLQNKVMEEYEKENTILRFDLIFQNYDIKKCEIYSASSKFREVESLHSKICTLLKNDPSLSFNDMLVVCPCLNDYESKIKQVFTQDDKYFLNIPCSFNNSKKGNSNLQVALEKLIEIYNKGFYTRNDFYELITNPLIKYLRDIDEQNSLDLASAICSMNVYRNSDNSNDWDYAKKRVLLSKLITSNIEEGEYVTLKDGNYIPYSNIALNDELIVKFVTVINDLNSFVQVLSNVSFINQENLSLIQNELDKWFSDKDDLIEKNYYYTPLLKTIDIWKSYAISNKEIPLNTFLFSLLDSAKSITFNKGDLFLEGVSFVDFDILSIYAAKYVFFIGLNSTSLPVRNIKGELDLRKDDLNNIKEQEEAFLLCCQNATNTVYLSYLDKDLKTDEELFMSSFLSTLMKKNKINEKEITHMSLDEDDKRSWHDLFTKREYKNKDYYCGLSKIEEQQEKQEENYIDFSEKSRRIKLKEFSSFLKEPLMYSAEKVFGKQNDIKDEIVNEYETFDFTRLDNFIVESEVILYLIDKKKEVLDDDDINAVIAKFDLNHALPFISQEMKKSAIDRMKSECEETIRWINSITESNYYLKTGNDFVFEYNAEQFFIFNETEYIVSEKGKEIKYFEVKPIQSGSMNDSKHKLCELYMFSLFDVASRKEKQYSVQIIKNEKLHAKYDLTPSLAKEMIIKIYKEMSMNINWKCFPLQYENMKNKNLHELIKKLNNPSKNPWGYFKDANLFDKEKQLGYSEENFAQEFTEMRDYIISLILFIKERGGNSDETI